MKGVARQHACEEQRQLDEDKERGGKLRGPSQCFVGDVEPPPADGGGLRERFRHAQPSFPAYFSRSAQAWSPNFLFHSS